MNIKHSGKYVVPKKITNTELRKINKQFLPMNMFQIGGNDLNIIFCKKYYPTIIQKYKEFAKEIDPNYEIYEKNIDYDVIKEQNFLQYYDERYQTWGNTEYCLQDVFLLLHKPVPVPAPAAPAHAPALTHPSSPQSLYPSLGNLLNPETPIPLKGGYRKKRTTKHKQSRKTKKTIRKTKRTIRKTKKTQKRRRANKRR